LGYLLPIWWSCFSLHDTIIYEDQINLIFPVNINMCSRQNHELLIYQF
jgi:hypothetical protein